MKNILLTLLLLPVNLLLQAQAVGYQGKNCIVKAGFLPVNNLFARSIGYSLDDDYYDDRKDPVLFYPVARFSVEYAIFKNWSIEARYNPMHMSANILYSDNVSDTYDLILGTSAGSMYSLSFKYYLTETAAPLGNYFSLSPALYAYSTRLEESKFAENPAPQALLDQTFPDVQLAGIFIGYGWQTVFWDKVALDLSLEAGFFMQDAATAETFDPILADGRYAITYRGPLQANFTNLKGFLFAVPAIQVGYLLF